MLGLLDSMRGPVNRSAFIAGVVHRYLESDEQRMRKLNY